MKTNPYELAGEAPAEGMHIVFTPEFSSDKSTWWVSKAWWVKDSSIGNRSGPVSLQEYTDWLG